jgi:hypothetical protein
MCMMQAPALRAYVNEVRRPTDAQVCKPGATAKTGLLGRELTNYGMQLTGCTTSVFPLFVEGGGSVIAPSGREPGAALALGTPDTIPSCGRRDRRAG